MISGKERDNDKVLEKGGSRGWWVREVEVGEADYIIRSRNDVVSVRRSSDRQATF